MLRTQTQIASIYNKMPIILHHSLVQKREITCLTISVPPQAQSQNITQPGVPFSLNFTVASNTIGGNYTIRARTDLVETDVSFPSSLILVAGGSAQGSVTLTVPSKTESGTAVTLTIEAEAPGSTDLNYAIVQLTVSTASAIFSGCYSLCMCLSFSWFFVSHFV